MATSVYSKTKKDADARAKKLVLSYRHVTIHPIRAEWEICYCCAQNPRIAELHLKVGITCQYQTKGE